MRKVFIFYLLIFWINKVCIGQENVFYIDEEKNIFDSVLGLVNYEIKNNDGFYLVFDSRRNGILVAQGEIKNKKKIGNEMLFDNGLVYKIINYANDEKERKIYYFNNGKIINYIHLNGLSRLDQKQFFPSGRLKLTLMKSTSFFIEKSFFENGRISRIDTLMDDAINNFQPIRSTSIFCENGQLISYFKFSKSVKTSFIERYCNGKVKSITNCLGDPYTKIGNYNEYYENGVIKIKGAYKNTNNVNEANIKIGKWAFYNEKGDVIREEKYSKKGELLNK